MRLDAKKTGLLTAVLTVLTTAWMRAYSKTGISFENAFQATQAMNLITKNTVQWLGITAVIISAVVITVLYFKKTMIRNEIAVSIIISTIINIWVSAAWVEKTTIFTVMMFFYALGLLWMASSAIPQHEKALQKMKTGWASAKKLFTLLALGGLITGVVFTYANQQYYEDKTIESIAEFASMQASEMNYSQIISSMNIAGLIGSISAEDMLSKEDFEQIARNSISKDQVRAMLEEQYGSYFTSLSEEEQQQMIDSTYNSLVDYFANNYDPQTLQAIIDSMSEQISENIQTQLAESSAFQDISSKLTKDAMTQLLKEQPMFSKLMKLLPIFTGMIISGIILTFGLVVKTITAILALLLPTEELLNPKKPNIKTALPYELQKKE